MQESEDPNLENSLLVTFEIETMSFNEVQKVMLKPEGHKIYVSQANKQEYI